MNNLPSSWVTVPLEYIARVDMGQSPESRFYNDRGEGLPFFQGKSEFGSLYPTVRKWCTDPKKIADKGDILLSVRAPVGPTNVATEKCCIGRGLAAIRAQDPISQTYLLHLLRNMESWLSDQGTGTTFAAVSGQFLRSIDVALAPLNEQKRIADKLDAVLARVDACRDRLDRIPVILKRFRQSLLAAATSGWLTEDWRSGSPIESTWSSQNLGDYVENCDGKRVPISEILRAARHGDYPYYGASGVIDTIDGYTHDGKFLLIGEDGANLLTRSKPIAFVATGKIWVNNHAHVLQCRDGAPEEFLGYFINSIDLAPYVSGSAQPKLNQKNMNSIVVPVPPIAEQHEIVRRVEALFAYADRLEARYTAARAQVEKLTPSTLAKAFRGELVPQDPNDEPASALIERIRSTASSKAKQIKTQRKNPMTKNRTESVKAIIHKMPNNRFSFDELRNQITGDYETLKDIVFALLSESEPMLRQVFDEKAQAMCFEKA